MPISSLGRGLRKNVTRQMIIDQRRGKLSTAAKIIARTPALRGYARSGSAYTAKFTYGKSYTGELKFFDTQNLFTFDTTGEVPATGQLNLVPQGVNESERIGRKITIRSIHMRATIASTVGTWTGNDFLRLCLVQDTQCNGAAATYSGVGGVLEGDTTQAFRNLENSERFIILKDWFIPMNAQAGVATAYQLGSRVLTFNKKCFIPIEYDSAATTGAIGTIRSNNLFLIARSQTNDDVIQLSGFTRIRYTDN